MQKCVLYVYTYTHVCIYIYTHTHTLIHTYTHVDAGVYVYIVMCAYIYICNMSVLAFVSMSLGLSPDNSGTS